jgi:two-component system LytT family response regulator
MKDKSGNPKQLEVIGHHTERKLDNLAVPTMEGLLFLGLQDIIRCESEDKYTKIFLVDKKMILSSRTLGDFEDLLSLHGFFRIHKSHIVNLRHLKKYLRGEGGQVVMADGSTLDVSRKKKDELLAIVSQF